MPVLLVMPNEPRGTRHPQKPRSNGRDRSVRPRPRPHPLVLPRLPHQRRQARMSEARRTNPRPYLDRPHRRSRSQSTVQPRVSPRLLLRERPSATVQCLPQPMRRRSRLGRGVHLSRYKSRLDRLSRPRGRPVRRSPFKAHRARRAWSAAGCHLMSRRRSSSRTAHPVWCRRQSRATRTSCLERRRYASLCRVR